MEFKGWHIWNVQVEFWGYIKNNIWGQLTGRIFEDESVQFVIELQWSMKSTSLATLVDGTLLGADQQIRFRIFTTRTQDEFPNEAVQEILQLVGFVRTINDETIIFKIELGLGAEFAAKIFRRIWNQEIIVQAHGSHSSEVLPMQNKSNCIQGVSRVDD